MNLTLKALKVLIAAFSSLLILACLGAIGIFIFLEHKAAEYTSGGDPVQFYRQADASLLEDYKNVLGAAHNSGNSQKTTRQALAHGADIIEIDIVYFNGWLYAAHHSPLRYIGSRFFRGPSLPEVWDASAQSNVIMLDLKSSKPQMLEALVSFLSTKKEHEVAAVSGDPMVLGYLKDRMPNVIRLYSVHNEKTLDNLLRDDAMMSSIDGVTVKHTALSAESAALLKGSGKIIFAWTVNDLERVNELVKQRVDGIITDNLAILELLSDQQQGELSLRSLVKRN